MRRTDLTLIRRAKLFSGVPGSDVTAMLAPCFVQPLPEAAVLCHQGERPEFLHIVVSGRVGLFGESERDEVLVEIFGPGDAFIVPAVALDMPSLLTARMLDPGRILMWPAAAFRADLHDSGPLAYGAMLQLSAYWRMLVSQIKDLKLLSAVERLSALLLALAPRGTGAVKAILPGNRKLVAGLLGVAPQSLSRAFAALRPLGVSGAGREISILDAARLREFANTREPKAAADEDLGLGRRLPKHIAPHPRPRRAVRK
jgi:CRP/FNR family transcriptional regulator, transcriptional activator FtrB